MSIGSLVIYANMSTKKSNKKKSEEVRVNLGCGSRILPGWINIDAYFQPNDTKDYVQGDARELPLESNSVDYLLADNVLEHIPQYDLPVVIHEIRRVLKPGGRAILAVPDFRSAVDQWCKIDHDKSFNPFTYQYLSEVIYGNQIHEGELHRTAFSPGFFNYLLLMCGFRKFKMIMHQAFSDLPNYPGIEAPPGTKCRNAQLVADITK
jgi:SAM-dependent methyltransferase